MMNADVLESRKLDDSWRWTELGELGNAIRGVTFAGGEGVPDPLPNTVACLTTSGVQEEVNWKSRRFIPIARVANQKQMLQKGDLLISTANSKELVGKSCLVRNIPYPCTFGAFVTVFRPNQKIEPTLLAYWMRTSEFLRFCYQASSNTTNISNLRTTELLEKRIPLPPLPEQRRIAALLDKADHLRRTRRYAAQLSDTFLQAVFVRMFGDPVRNLIGWDVEYFGDVCDTRLGKMLDAKQQTGRHLRPYLRNVNVQWGQIGLADVQEMDFDEEDREEFRLKAGDVLICEGGEVGRAAIWKDELPECYFQKALHRARPDPNKATPEFIVQLMWTLADLGGLVQSVSEVTFAHLTGVRLKELKVPLPPLALQQKFARIVQQFERLRAQQREAERQAEHLFQTLLHMAFSQLL